jgi:hypothetical protein
MENLNANPTNPQGGELSPELTNLFTDYHKKQNQVSSRRSREDLLKRYFIPRNSIEIFRILPTKGKKRIEEAFFHVVTTNAAGGKKKHGTVIYCPAHNDPKVPKLDPITGKPLLDGNGNPIMIPAPCPLCDKAKAILAKQDNSIKGKKKDELNAAQQVIFDKNKEIFIAANALAAKKFYIVKGVDKGRTTDGVKFWRFKHNYKNQGTLDKLLPMLEIFTKDYQKDYSDPNFGSDLNIVMTNTEWNGRVYKTISAISAKAPSKLHDDPIIVDMLLSDDTTWRDVFFPKKAPGITPYEYLQLVAEGNSPYWEDSDANNKHWVFPNNPKLEEAANTRNRNLDADSNDNYEYASDLDDEYPTVSIETMTPSKVGTYRDDASNVGAEILTNQKPRVVNEEPMVDPLSGISDYGDLPF